MDDNLQFFRVISQGLNRRLRPGDITVMVRSPDINNLVEAADELIVVIGRVGSEIGGNTGGPHQHTILLITVISGAQPQCSLRLIGMSAFSQ